MTDLDMSGFVHRVDKPTVNTPEQRRNAVRATASRAHDTDDLRLLLDVLGLDPAEGRS